MVRPRVVSTVSLKKITIEIERETWRRFKSLLDENGKPNAIFHLRRAMDLYLRVLEAEDPAKFFEDQESEEGLHAYSSFGRASV